jgi:hypothetical protein
MFGPEGDRLITLALLDIYSHALIDDDVATSAAAGYEEPHGRPDSFSPARD